MAAPRPARDDDPNITLVTPKPQENRAAFTTSSQSAAGPVEKIHQFVAQQGRSNSARAQSNDPMATDVRNYLRQKQSSGFFDEAIHQDSPQMNNVIDNAAWQADWFHPTSNTDEVIELVPNADGGFAVQYTKQEVVLLVNHDGNVNSYPLALTDNDIRISGSLNVFPTLSALIAAYQESARDLSIQLLDSRNAAVIPREGEANVGQPMRIADVCAWLETIHFDQYKHAFARQKVDGLVLAELTPQMLQERFGMMQREADEFIAERDALDRGRITLPLFVERHRQTFYVRETNGRLRVFDADTNEEVYKMTDQILASLRETHPHLANRLSELKEPAIGEFCWMGDALGWQRRMSDGQMKSQNAWDNADLRAWFEHVSLPELSAVLATETMTGATFANASTADLQALAAPHGLEGEIERAKDLFHCRVKRAANTMTSGVSAADSLNLDYVDPFAMTATWYFGTDHVAALTDLDDSEAPDGAFVVCENPQRHGELMLEVLQDGANVDLAIKPVDSGIQLEGTTYIAKTLSELVAYHSAYHEDQEQPPLLSPETDPFRHERMPWYLNFTPSIEDVQTLQTRPVGSFLLHPKNGSKDFCLQILRGSDIGKYFIQNEEQGVRIMSSKYVFATFMDLIDFYSFVPSNDLAFNLYRDAAQEVPILAMEAEAEAWLYPDLDRERAEQLLVNKPDGTFAIRDGSEEAAWVLSYACGGQVEHAHMDAVETGIGLRDHEARFQTLQAFVDYYSSSSQRGLRCPLGELLSEDAEPTPKHEPLSRRDEASSGPGAELEPLQTDDWFHPNMSREEAETRLDGQPDGVFLVRRSTTTNAHVISYAAENETHHALVDTIEDGFVVRDSNTVFASLDVLINYHRDPSQENLLHHLTVPIAVAPTSGASPNASPNPRPSGPVHSADMRRESSQNDLQPGSGILGTRRYPWLMLHPHSREAALDTIANREDGAFVIRSSQRVPECMVLSFVNGDRILHELIVVDIDERDNEIGLHLMIDDQRIFPDVRSLVDFHSQHKRVLPVLLCEDAQERASSRRLTMGAVSMVGDRSARTQEDVYTYETDANGPVTGFLRETAPWIVTGLREQDALSLIYDKPDGTFIVRPSDHAQASLVLCYIFQGMVEQELIVMHEEGFSLRRHTSQTFSTLHDMVAYYSQYQAVLKCCLRQFDSVLQLQSAQQSNMFNQQQQQQQSSHMQRGQSNMQLAYPTSMAQHREETLTIDKQRRMSRAILQNSGTLDFNNTVFFANDEPQASSRTLRRNQLALPAPSSNSQHNSDGRKHYHQRHHRHHHHHGGHSSSHSRHHESSDSRGHRRYGSNSSLSSVSSDEAERRRRYDNERRRRHRRSRYQSQRRSHADRGYAGRHESRLSSGRYSRPEHDDYGHKSQGRSSRGYDSLGHGGRGSHGENRSHYHHHHEHHRHHGGHRHSRANGAYRVYEEEPRRYSRQVSEGTQTRQRKANEGTQTRPRKSTEYTQTRRSADDTLPTRPRSRSESKRRSSMVIIDEDYSWLQMDYTKNEVKNRVPYETGAFVMHQSKHKGHVATLTYRDKNWKLRSVEVVRRKDNRIALAHSDKTFKAKRDLVYYYAENTRSVLGTRLRLPTSQV